MTVNVSGPLLTRLGGVDVLSWNPVRAVDGEAGARLVNNFGDLLGPLLVERIAGTAALRRKPPKSSAPKVLAAVGSIMHFAPHRAVVWGSGVNFKLNKKLPRGILTLDFRAVRGPYSARAITAAGAEVPAVFGDPALLLPRYMPELDDWTRSGSGGAIVVPNLNDFEAMAAEAAAQKLTVVDPRGPLHIVLREIAGSGFVVGSSLHAIAIADALGIPARFIASPAEGVLKYRDYLAGTGRPLAHIAPDLETAIALGGHAKSEVDLDRLLAAFPYDLWKVPRGSRNEAAFRERPAIISAWKDLLAEPAPDMAARAETFVDEVFPGLIEVGRRALAEASAGEEPWSRGATPEADAFAVSFADAYAQRVALAADVVESDLAEPHRPYLAALDTASESQFLRQLWLEREGSHALMQSARAGGGLQAFSIALRPGSLTNDLTDIEVVVEDDSDRVHRVHVPVFAMYRRQWTIDVSATLALGPEARAVTVSVELTHHSGRLARIIVQDAPRGVVSLRGRFLCVGNLPRWSGISSSVAQDVAEE